MGRPLHCHRCVPFSLIRLNRTVFHSLTVQFDTIGLSTFIVLDVPLYFTQYAKRSFWCRIYAHFEKGSFQKTVLMVLAKVILVPSPANSSCSKLKKKCVFRHFQCDDFQFLVTLVKNFSSHWQTVGFANVTTNFSQCDDDKNLSSDWKHHLNLSSHWHSKCMNLEFLKKICRHIGR